MEKCRIINTSEYIHLYTPIDFDKSIRCDDEERNKLNLELFNKIEFDENKLQCIFLSKRGYLLASIDENNNFKPFSIKLNSVSI